MNKLYLLISLVVFSCVNKKENTVKTASVFTNQKKSVCNVSIIPITEDSTKIKNNESYVNLKDLLISNSCIGYNSHESDNYISLQVFDLIYGKNRKNATMKQKMDILYLFDLGYYREDQNYRAMVSGHLRRGDTSVINNPIFLLPLIEIDDCGPFLPKFLLNQKKINTPKVYKSYAESYIKLLFELPSNQFADSLNSIKTKLKSQKRKVDLNNKLLLEFYQTSNK